jgi:acyl-CoA thioesterase II
MYALPICMYHALNSLFQGYFLLGASPAIPILYHVRRVRDGRSYVTRSVRAVQEGNVVFILLCSFQKPEPWQPAQQWKMPLNVPPPDDCELEEVRLTRFANKPGLAENAKKGLLMIATVRLYPFTRRFVHSSRFSGPFAEPYKDQDGQGALRI